MKKSASIPPRTSPPKLSKLCKFTNFDTFTHGDLVAVVAELMHDVEGEFDGV